MISFTSILTTIKGASLAAKVSLSVGAVAVVAGGAAGTVAIISSDKTHDETQIVASSPNDDNSPSEPAKAESEENGESKDDNKETEQEASTTKPATNTNNVPQPATQKPSSNTSTSTNQSQSSNNSSASNPSTSTTPAAQPASPSVRPSQSSQPSQPSTSTTQPTQPTESEKKPDYNLNDNYAIAFCGGIISGQDVSFQVIDRSPDVAMNSCVAKIYNEARRHSEYAGMTDEELSNEVLGMGSAGPLDEDMCARNSLSCGRW